jgi:vacuolar iron transporter family protein
MMKQSRHLSRYSQKLSSRSNWLRAAVLGSNDGIVSIAGLVVGVAGATDSKLIILTAGVAGIVAGAVSMAAGEYVSVSTQRDIEKESLKNEGESSGFDPNNLTSPWRAAVASSSAFLIGSIIPLVAVMLPLGDLTILVTFSSVIVALIITGLLSAKLGGINKTMSVIRIVTGGAIAMIVTYSIGSLFNISGL